MNFEDFHIEIAEPPAGEIETKERRIVGNLRTAINRFKAAVAFLLAHAENLQLIEPLSVIIDRPLRSADLPKDAENPSGTDARGFDNSGGAGFKLHQRLDLVLVFHGTLFAPGI